MGMGILFLHNDEVVDIRINGHHILFRSSKWGNGFMPIEALSLSEEGIFREFPDLKGKEDYRALAIERFKKHIKNLGSENKISEYIIEELKKYGYVPHSKQKDGHRVERII